MTLSWWGCRALLQPLSFLLPPPALCIVTFIFYATSVAAIVLLYVYYTKPQGCTEGKVLISINLILCLIVSAVSILPKIQVRWQGGHLGGWWPCHRGVQDQP